MSQYIGKTISLISSKGIRYVGILSDVNGEEATVTLKNVKPYGTEGRIGDPSKEIPAVDDTYPVVVFRGSDVRDLSVLDDASAPATTPAPAPAAAPATTTREKYEPVNESSDEEEEEEEVKPAKEEKVYQRKPQYQQQPRQVNNFADASVPDSDFDFESSNAKFDTEEKDELQREKDTTEVTEPAYDKKKSFFDNISNSATEKRPMRPAFTLNQRNDGRPNFGNNRPDFGNSNRRGRGGRGRGQGRGQGRGGYRGQWSNDNTDYASY